MLNKTIVEIKKLNKILNKQQKKYFFAVLLWAVLASLLEMIGVTIIIPVIKLMVAPEELFEYSIIKPFVTFFNITTVHGLVVFVISCVILLFLLKNIYMIFFYWIKAKFATKIHREVAVYMMTSYMNRGYSYFLNKNASEIIQGVSSDSLALYNILNLIITIFVKTMMVILIGLYLVYTDFALAIGVIVASFICLLFLVFGLKKRMKEIGIKLRYYTIESNTTLFQAIYGIKEVLVMRKQKSFTEMYEERLEKRQIQEKWRAVISEAPSNIIEAVCITIVMIILGVRVITINNSEGFLEILAAFAMGAFRILPSIGVISGSFGSIIANKPGLDSIYENIIEARKNNDLFNDVDVHDLKEYENITFERNINIDNVSFRYSPNSEYILRNIQISIDKNTSLALVGESGAGKSTLADVILGILPVETGKITIDDINVRDIPNAWSRLIGFVPQSIYLSDTSVAENVAFGIKESLIDRNRVREVLEMANVLSFIDTLPKGMDTVIGDRGVRLSGGQRQRIGIARALYHNPQILILDEATSALDNETETHVMEAIESLQGKITMIIIAHRLTTIKNCDKIYEIVDKKAVERKYEDLV